MKQYGHFGEYMFDLLFAPLKKGKRAANQFYIFFKVIGRIFDNLKTDALRVRDETNIATASPIMLPVHGQDRNVPRLAGESIEGYRTRLVMKGIISEWGGTRQGILYNLAALGYERAHIELVGPQDPERWAEFIVDLGIGSVGAVRDVYQIYNEIQSVKEGSSRLSALILTSPTSYGETPTLAALGPRMATAAPPMHRPRPEPGRLTARAALGTRYSRASPPMAAGNTPLG